MKSVSRYFVWVTLASAGCSTYSATVIISDAGVTTDAGLGGSISAGGESYVIGGSTNQGGPASVGGLSATGGSGTTVVTAGSGGAPATGGSTTIGTASGGTPATTINGGAVSVTTEGTIPLADGGTGAIGGAPTSNYGTGGASTGGAQPSTGAAGTGGSSAAPCPSKGGPSMLKLPQGYCIDRTEVTRGQYDAWLATSPALPPSNDPNCGWKAAGSYAPDATCMAGTYVCQGTACGNHPQVCVDWCDAYAYCAAAGKRLCGKIGGLTNAYMDYANANLSQWYSACSSGGVNSYPYDGAYQANACNGLDYWASNMNSAATTPVGSIPTCQATDSYSGIYDLSGNVWEWEDSFNGAGQSANCRVRGGSFNFLGGSSLACGIASAEPRNFVSFAVGFRCCAF